MMTARQIARGLGWYSIALGTLELLAPGRMSRALGLGSRASLVRTYGLRELAHGAAILTQRNPAPWVWTRVAGDALDLLVLGKALGRPARGARLAVLAVLGTTIVDVLCARQLSQPTSPKGLLGRLVHRRGK
ncbi:hypothetical protein [Deinococcus peraridilitoris]|uniref:hypothetical protein n=1 Tax=Deinococcus peraridilitoris TaxID=432329 RepID=UPI00031EB4F1|nr:hypothetical protein [Deinococcus peraridilitoris]